MSVSEVLGESKGIEILLALLDGCKHVRALQREVGGGLSTIGQRIEGLIKAGLVKEIGERAGYRDLELTDRGRSLATIIVSMDKVSSPSTRAPLSGKEKWILILLHGLGEVQGTVRLEKLLFFLKERFKVVGNDFYFFRPHIFGPYSPEVYIDVKNLNAVELVETDEKVFGTRELGDWIYMKKTYYLTVKGEAKASESYSELTDDSKVREAIWRLQEYNAMPLNNLLSYVWKRYPEYNIVEEPI